MRVWARFSSGNGFGKRWDIGSDKGLAKGLSKYLGVRYNWCERNKTFLCEEFIWSFYWVHEILPIYSGFMIFDNFPLLFFTHIS